MRNMILVAIALSGLSPQPVLAQRLLPTDIVWPPPPEAPRVRYVGLVRTDWDIGRKPSFVARVKRALLGVRPDFNAVQRPHDVYVDDGRRIYVSDGAYGKVLVFDPGEKKARIIGNGGSGALAKPLGLGGDGNRLFVADASGKRVVVFDSSGKFVRAYGGPQVLLNPVDVAVDPERGRVYVVDSYLHQLLVFDAAGGALISRIGKDVEDLAAKVKFGRWGGGTKHAKEVRDLADNRGTGPGEFRYPGFVAVAPDGTVYVADQMNFRVQAFDPEGRFVRQIGRNGDVPGAFARPKGLGVDGEGHVYVADAAFGNIQVFDSEGNLLLVFGGMGQGDGELWFPFGLYLDRENRVYVADRQNQRIQIYQYVPMMIAEQPGLLAVNAGAYHVAFETSPADIQPGAPVVVRFRVTKAAADGKRAPVTGLKATIRCVEPEGVFEDHEVRDSGGGVYQVSHTFPTSGEAVATVSFTGADGLPASASVQLAVREGKAGPRVIGGS